MDITPQRAISAKSVTLTISAYLPAAAAAALAFSPSATHFLQPEPRILMIIAGLLSDEPVSDFVEGEADGQDARAHHTKEGEQQRSFTTRFAYTYSFGDD